MNYKIAISPNNNSASVGVHPLEETQRYSKSNLSNISHSQRNADYLESSKTSTQKNYRDVSRVKQVLESEKDEDVWNAPQSSRDEYVAQIVNEDETIKEVKQEISNLSQNIADMRETSVGAQKRLTVVRLMSMLDDLQNALNEKINGPQGDEEARTQELLKLIQELTRSREKTLMLMSKKEREFQAIIQLKKKRVAELQSESARNMNNLAQANDNEVLNVAQRIQKERRTLITELERQEDTNERLATVMRDTKYSVECATKDRKTALSADDALGTSDNPENEMLELRQRITAADVERRRLTKKTEEIKKHTETEAERYNEKMSQLKREILMYQGECGRLEKENKDLKSLCDSMAVSLQS